MTLTWGNIKDAAFIESLSKLLGRPMGYDLAVRFAVLGKEIKNQRKLCNETFDSILKKYGTPVKEQPGNYSVPPEKRAEYQVEVEKLERHEFTMKVTKFDGAKLAGVVELLPQDLMALDPILNPIEAPATEPKYERPALVKDAAPPAH